MLRMMDSSGLPLENMVGAAPSADLEEVSMVLAWLSGTHVPFVGFGSAEPGSTSMEWSRSALT